ncbi:amino acid transporter, putative [Perkinsus marinus ATCC 50983]|uniref:Amino acid transporter, putative n=1 Tax=Perkinsus marinus (strain ATCC 50983 / TXsc) TaxID=423536 RepID=C5L7J3_PERM5|nr:amino acid transporter, putative [Perkinsus marinus ATCC 50983]EER07455.1 amino acid transporter, putative [Perkinsus marinus ATCC 50983]|eukprot:XP_002775639.1 amino acid transporter, putative [Perkinsus marinus ATCC 50983]
MGVETSPFLAPQELPSYESAAMKNLTTLEGHGYSTPLSTVFNIVNTMVGLGMFALPYVFGVVGYLTGSIIFIGAVLASYLSAYVLTMVLSGYLEEYSYYALATRLFKGRTMSLAIDIVLAVVLFGVILGTLSHSGRKSLHGVRFASYTGVGLMLLIWVSVVFTVIFNPLDSVDVEPVPLEVDTTRSWVPFSQAASAGVFSFIMHINLPCLHGELKPIDRPKMPLLLAIALAWAFVMYIIFAVCASCSPLFYYGRVPDLLMALPRTLLFDTCRVLIVVVNITKTPLLLHPLRQIVDTRLNVPEQLNWLATSAIIIISYCLFLWFNSLVEAVSIISAICSILTVQWFPAICMWASAKLDATRKREPLLPRRSDYHTCIWSIKTRRIVAIILGLLGVLVGVLTGPSIIYLVTK